nr:hypothetical protein [Tanacetum cinerariifolium]
MSTQQDIYASGSESRPPMLNKENYVPWSPRLLWYAKSRPNGKLIHNSILNGPYIRKMIPEPGDANRDITVTETFHLQTDDEVSDKELKQIEADDQAIQTILLGLPEDIYAAAKLFNKWERFTSNEGESIESYYHRFLKLINDLKRNKHFPEKIASNLKFLNNLQPEWSRHVTIVHQTKDLHTADYTQLYDFLKYNQNEVDELKAERLAKTQDPLALMANSNNPYRISSNPRNRQIAQPGMNMGQDRQMQIVRGNGGNQFRQYAGQNAGNPAGYNDVIGNQVIQNAVQNPRVQNVRNQNGLIGVQGNGNQNQIGNEARIQLQVEEYDLMAAAANLDEIEEVNANCILMANLLQASTSGTQTDSALVYDTNGSAEVHENCDDNEIFNMFTQEEQYTELLEPIPESHQVPQNDNDVISKDTSVEQGGETVKQQPANFEETRALYESLYQNLAIKVEKVNSALSREELYFSNNSKTANVSKSFLIPNEDLSDDTAPSVARKFLNEVKSTILTLQRVVKQRMTIETHNWASSAHQEFHKIVREEIFHIVNQVDARVQNFELQFLKEAAKFVGDFKSLANEADASLAKHKALELEIKRLLKAVVSQDIMNIVQNKSVVDTSDLQTKLERTKERFENCIIKKETEYAKLWNDWYKKCDECKYDKISYDKADKDMQQKIKRLQAQLGDLKGKSKDTSSV